MCRASLSAFPLHFSSSSSLHIERPLHSGRVGCSVVPSLRILFKRDNAIAITRGHNSWIGTTRRTSLPPPPPLHFHPWRRWRRHVLLFAQVNASLSLHNALKSVFERGRRATLAENADPHSAPSPLPPSLPPPPPPPPLSRLRFNCVFLAHCPFPPSDVRRSSLCSHINLQLRHTQSVREGAGAGARAGLL